VDLKTSFVESDFSAEVNQALDEIHSALFDPHLHAGAVREAIGAKNNNFSSVFKREVGIGMRAYIETMRIEMAKRLLRYRHLSVLDIAGSVGYVYAESFSRAFRRYVGLSPTQFRERIMRPSRGRA
jgi:two-component system response regulator YesN